MRQKRKRPWTSSITYGFVRSRQLDGTLFEGPRIGTYIVSSARVLAGWGCVSEKRWPRLRRGIDFWPPLEPTGLDDIAKYNRQNGHWRARDLSEIKKYVVAGVPVQIVVPIHRGWMSATGGVIALPRSDKEFTQNHAVVIENYNASEMLLKFWNNWGPSWGDREYGYLPSEYVEKYMRDAWVFDLSLAKLTKEEKAQYTHHLVRRMAYRNQFGHTRAQIEVWDVSNDVRVGWCFAVIRDYWFEIEDFFLRSDYKTSADFSRLVYDIIDSAKFFQRPIRYWIPDADIHAKGLNFDNVNDLIRTLKLNVKKSEVMWAPFRADQ